MNSRSKVNLAVIVIPLIFISSFAQEKPPWVEELPRIEGNPAAGKSKAESCGVCHGSEGISGHYYYPNLAGQKEEYLLYQLHYYRSGKRPSHLMNPVSLALTDTDIADIAAYYASLNVVPTLDKSACASATSDDTLQSP